MAYPIVAIPGISAAMQRDPRVALAQAALAQAGSTAPVYGTGGGLARILQGVAGGLGEKAAQKQFGAAQDQYMGDVRNALASVLGGNNPNNPATAVGATPAAGGFTGTPSATIAPPTPQTPVTPPQGPLNPGPSAFPVSGGVDPLAAQGGPPNGLPAQASPTAVAATQGPPGGPPIPGGPPGMNPNMPVPPKVPTPLDSTRLKLGQALLGSNSPFSFSEGLQDVNAGLEEKAQNDALAQAREYELGKTLYGAQLNDFYDAQASGRQYGYTKARDEYQHTWSQEELRQRFEHDWAMQKDQQGFTAGENDKERLFNTYKMIADTTGEIPSDLTNMTPDAVWGSIKKQESGGEKQPGLAVNAESGALGSTQMLPETAQAMATKLGIPWQPELMHSNTQEALTYQNTLGRAYFDEGLEKYNGDLRKATAYYFAGPDESKWKQKTSAYVSQVFGRLPGTVGLVGADKLNGNLLYGINPYTNQKKAVPQRTQSTLNDLGDQAAQLISLNQGFNDSYFGYGSGIVGRTANLFTENTGMGDTSRVDWWKQYDAMNNVVRHNLFGSALTKNEQYLWDRSTVNPGTTPSVARTRLDTQWKLLQSALKRTSRSAAAAYNGRQVYEAIGGDNLSDYVTNYKPLSSVSEYSGTPRDNQVRQGGGIPKGTTITLDTPAPAPPQRRTVPQPTRKPDWLTAQVPGFTPGNGSILMRR